MSVQNYKDNEIEEFNDSTYRTLGWPVMFMLVS